MQGGGFTQDRNIAVVLPGWPSPVGPGLLAEHFVPLQAGLVGLPEGVARPPHPHVLQEPQVPDLVAHQGFVENVGSLFVIGFDAPAKGKPKGTSLHTEGTNNYHGEFKSRVSIVYPWTSRFMFVFYQIHRIFGTREYT